MMRREVLASAWPLAFGLALVGVPAAIAAVQHTEEYVAGIGMAVPGAGVFPSLSHFSIWTPIVFALVSVAEVAAAALGAWGPRGGIGLARRLWRAHVGLFLVCAMLIVQAFIHPAASADFYSPKPGHAGLVLSAGIGLGWLVVVVGLAWPARTSRPAPAAAPDR